MELTSDAVDQLVGKCLFTKEEAPDGTTPDNTLIVEGIMRKYGFHPDRVAENADAISALLSELPPEFQATNGGGWTFLNACYDRHGNQWTGLHAKMEALFCLGIAAGKARWLADRDMWSAFPGGMPYVSVN